MDAYIIFEDPFHRVISTSTVACGGLRGAVRVVHGRPTTPCSAHRLPLPSLVYKYTRRSPPLVSQL